MPVTSGVSNGEVKVRLRDWPVYQQGGRQGGGGAVRCILESNLLS